MYILKTITGSIFPLNDKKAIFYMKSQIDGKKFVIPIKDGEKVMTISSHQIAEIITLETYRRQKISQLAEKGKMMCEYCYYPKRIGSICGGCGGSPTVDQKFRNQENQAIFNLNEKYFLSNNLLK